MIPDLVSLHDSGDSTDHGIAEEMHRINGDKIDANEVWWKKIKDTTVKYDQYLQWNRTRRSIR